MPTLHRTVTLSLRRLGQRLALLAFAAGLCLALPARVDAAQNAMSFSRLGAEDGLSQGAVMSIVQDGRGFIWLGTEDGLNRFDGNEVKHYLRDRGDDSALPNNWIAALAVDAQGRLWIGTDGGGLVWRDAATGQFRRVLGSDGQPLVDPQERIRGLFVDQKQRIWLATRNAGIVIVDTEARTARRLRADQADSMPLSDDSIFELDEDAAGGIWAATGAGVDRIDLDRGRITHLGAELSKAMGTPSRVVKANTVLAETSGVVWVGTDSGLFRIDPAASRVQHYAHRPHDLNSLPGNRVNALRLDNDKRLWVGTASGLALYQPQNGRFSVFRNEAASAASLPDNNIVSLYQDRSGLLWIGTKTGGVARWNPRAWAFGHHTFLESALNQVTSFAVDSQGLLWVGSYGGGIAAVDRRNDAVRRITAESRQPLRISDNNVMALAVDDADRIWLGTMGAGVERIDPASKVVKRFLPVPDQDASLPAPGVMSLLRSTDRGIWVGTYGGGIARIDTRTDVVTRYPVSRNGSNGLSSDRATALAEDRAGRLWIGTDGGGLSVLDIATGRFRHFVHDARNSSSLAADTVYSLHVDTSGTVWVGTRGGGLDRAQGDPFSDRGLSFENFSENNGIPNNTIYGVQSDSIGRLWVSTNRGIAIIDPLSRSVRTFRRSHGLQGDEFNFGAHYRDRTGTIYFGGANGYNAFNPANLKVNNRPPPVQLIELLKLNTPASAVPETLKSVKLGFRDDVVTFRFAALDFTGPAENRYQYRLEGFDREWIDAGHLGQATYTNLDGGRYTLRVRAANSDGVWNEDGLSLAIDVDPPPWATWWARIGYVLLAALAIGLALRASQHRLEREAQYARRLELEVDERTNELAERNAQLVDVNKQLREASLTDPLTGLGNRRCLRDAMQAQVNSANGQRRVDGRGDVILVVDLDYLKPINDEHGHDGGDAVLIGVAGILRQIFRSADLIVRWGGDEFVVLCRDCDLITASELAERVRQTVAKTIFRVGNGIVSRTSTSIGFAPVPFVPGHVDTLDWEESLNLADAALYRAKKQRNTWLGWAGTAEAAGLPSIIAAIEADAEDLEQKGILTVLRGPVNIDDTIYRLRAKLGPHLR
jgi:diguanylate cyclase (GGDEF)-like protein